MTKLFFLFLIGVLLLVLLRQACPAPNDPVSIPAANLRAAIEQKLGKTSGATITEAEMAGITDFLDVGGIVNDLTGLQYATGVPSIKLLNSRNTLTDLSPLANLTQLTVLFVFHTGGLTDISALQNLTALRELSVRRLNPRASAGISDLTPLTNLTVLQILSLSGNAIEDLRPLSGLTALTNLILSDNKIVDITPLSGLTALKQLHLEGSLSYRSNNITNISPLSPLTKLEELRLGINRGLSNISPLRRLTNLRSLFLNFTNIDASDLSGVLPSLVSLKYLNIQGAIIPDLSVVLDNISTRTTLAILDLRYISYLSSDGRLLYASGLTDLTPLRRFVESGRIARDLAFNSPRIELQWNIRLDYDSIYEDLPALIHMLPTAWTPFDTPIPAGAVVYDRSTPTLQTFSAAADTGHPGTRYTCEVQGINNTRIGNTTYRRLFGRVPVRWRVDGGTEFLVPTGINGVSGFAFYLGNDGETHTVEAVVPENRPIPGEIEHDELRVTFTITADSTAPPPTHPDDRLTVTFEDYPEEKPSDEFTLTLKFSEPVIDFEKNDVTVETKLTRGKGMATLTELTPTTGHPAIGDLASESAPLAGLITLTEAEQTYTATVELPGRAAGTVRLIVRKDAAITPLALIGPEADTASEPIEFRSLPRVLVYPSRVAMDKIIFNEFRNARDDKNDWIELKNISNEPVSLIEWEVSLVLPHAISPATPQWEIFAMDREVVAFPDWTLPPGGILLIANTDPSENDLIRGQDIANPKHNPDRRPYYLLAPDMKLPQTPYLLILRSKRDKNGIPEAFEDLLGNYHKDDVNYRTNIWPLRDTPVYTGTEAFLTDSEVYQRVMAPRVSSLRPVPTLQPETRGYLRGAWTPSEHASGLGYRPGAPVATSLGTPGYPNAGGVNETGTGQISVSEVMFATLDGSTPSPAQWIELYNPSETEIMNLQGWELVITAANVPIPFRSTTLVLNSLEVLPNQTVLLVTGVSRHSENLPERRIYDLQAQHPGNRYLKLRANRVLSSEGFGVYLFSPDGTLVDRAGNLTGRRGQEKPRWELPTGWTETGARTSLIRRYENRVPAPGTVSSSWVRAADTSLLMGYSYYGLPTDDSTAGYRQGSPLPVTLSQFRANRSETGVVVNWTTQSEMENAGFYVLRRLEGASDFERITPSLIAGAGTTAERSTYTYRDTTAKANVAYYYRLEEVSLSGVRRVIGTVRLRGYVSAANKLLWKWVDVKTKE